MKSNYISNYISDVLWSVLFCITVMMVCSAAAYASVFGSIRGIVRDAQGNPVTIAKVMIRARASSFTRTVRTNSSGEFAFRAVPIGEYIVSVEQNGFSKLERATTIISDNAPVLEFNLEVAPITQRVEVVATTDTTRSDTATPTTLISREQIEKTPGADRTNSLALITNNVPGAYITHNQLHIRGGHQVSWLIDGVPVPNTNIADTVGAQFDPKDMDYLEVQRGSYSAEYGDRTYGVFNIVPRSGFERDREGELIASYGNFHQTNDQVSFGSHTKRFAYYASVTGSRSDYGLGTPTVDVLHDNENSVGGFASLIFEATVRDQLRLVTALRRDFFQVPNDRDAQDLGIRDVERERDSFINFSWVHTFNSKLLLTLSPFYHDNRVDYIGGVNDAPITPRDKRNSKYVGAQAVLSLLTRRHNAKAGFYGFFQQDATAFSIKGTSEDEGILISLAQRNNPRGNLEVVFIEDQYKPLSWLTLTGGIRFTRFHGLQSENATSPRLGAAIRIPRLNFVLHGFFGRYYQAPPLSTVAGPLLDFALDQGFGFIPLRGERDEEYQIGLTIPVKGFSIETDYFHTRVRNFFDHDALGNSNIFFPLTIEQARISGFETTLRSPLLFKRGRISLAYSHQRAEGQGVVSGGLTDFSPPDDGFFFLDHDQRNTLNVGFQTDLILKSYLSGNVRYGSGFVDGEGPAHLPGHTTFDLAIGKKFRENWTVSLQMVNVFNRRFLLDNSNTFGGTHFVEPRQIYIEVRRRFHF